MLGEEACEDVVASPPKEEKRPEKQGRRKTMVEALNAVRLQDLLGAIYRPAVKAFGLVCGILDLQPCLDVFNGSRDKADCPAGHDARDTVAECWQLAL